jgi:hypothetical protein
VALECFECGVHQRRCGNTQSAFSAAPEATIRTQRCIASLQLLYDAPSTWPLKMPTDLPTSGILAKILSCPVRELCLGPIPLRDVHMESLRGTARGSQCSRPVNNYLAQKAEHVPQERNEAIPGSGNALLIGCVRHKVNDPGSISTSLPMI